MNAAIRKRFGDAAGAFADTAVLLPLLLALAWQSGAAPAIMLATTGAAYWFTGWLFRLPIPVQPLKSLALVAIAVGASAVELQVAGIVLGAIYLALSRVRQLDRLAGRVPDVLVHGFQLGLGVMLVLTALRLVGAEVGTLAIFAAATAALVMGSRWTSLPLLGAIALAGLLWGMWHAVPVETPENAGALRLSTVVLMVLPQIALTLTNSVLGTQRTAQAYYAEAAERVTPRRLLGSLGVGNLVVGALGGMPYCHGSGGVTAHYRSGARSWRCNAIIGTALLAMAGTLALGGGGMPEFPPLLQAVLLAVIGLFHLQLAAPSWRARASRWILLSMGATALLLQNMLIVLAVGLVTIGTDHARRRRRTPDEAPAEDGDARQEVPSS